ncbi:MAG: glycine cleavage system protein GcvH [Chloroflexota bacterium]
MNLDANAKYQDTHEWARLDGDVYTVGITDFAQDNLNDVVFVELPKVGDSLEKGETFGVVESVKSASDLYMPMSGEIVEINEALEDAPELVNEDPYGNGWMIKFKASNTGEWDSLLSGADYEASASSD